MKVTPPPPNRHARRRTAALAKIGHIGPFLESHLSQFKRPGCAQPGWHLTFKQYVLTRKEGRQPTLWSELIELLPQSRANTFCTSPRTNGHLGRLDDRWVENWMLGSGWNMFSVPKLPPPKTTTP